MKSSRESASQSSNTVIPFEAGDRIVTAVFSRRAARNRVVALRITIVACLTLMAKAVMVVDGVPLFAVDQ